MVTREGEEQQCPSRRDPVGPTNARGLKRTAEFPRPYSNEAKLSNGNFRCLLCNATIRWYRWNTHAAEEGHCDRLAEQARGEQGPPIDRQQLIQPPVPIYDLQRIREQPERLLYLTGPDLAEPVQRWVMESAGIKESAAHELRTAMLTSFADVLSVEDPRFRRISSTLTELAAGVALANISAAFTKLASEQGGDSYHYSFSPTVTYCYQDGSCLVIHQAAHIAALAQLAPRATELRVNRISLSKESAPLFHDYDLLWLAACRLLLSSLQRLPHPPQQVSITLPDTDDAPGSAGEFALSLLARPELHTLFDKIEIEAWSQEQADEVHAAVPVAKWTETTCQTVRNIRATILLGARRSKTSPLRLVPPLLMPMILKHIKPCSLTIEHLEETESDSEELELRTEEDIFWRHDILEDGDDYDEM